MVSVSVSTPSIAFCFLLYSKIDNPDQWASFFKYVDPNKYTIYSHLKIIDETTQDYIKENAIKSIETQWGTYSLLKASLLLYKEALKNKNNTHIILLSGSCIPIYSFDYIYNELMSDSRSRIHCKYLKRHNIWAASQWMTLNRINALSITRLLNKNDDIAKKFIKYWSKETDVNGSGFLSNEIGPDEVGPINWFLYEYSLKELLNHKIYDQNLDPKIVKNAIFSDKFQENIKIACITYAYFRRNATSPVNFSEKSNFLKKQENVMCNNCLFSRKFSNDKNTFMCPNKSKSKNKNKLKINENYWGPMLL